MSRIKNAPKVSVIIAVYNAEKYLSVCIESVLAQTMGDFEVILVDDGSHDKSGIICDNWARSDIRIKVIHQENRGVSVARNRGLEVATGTFVTFIDSDDSVSPVYLSAFSYDYDLSLQGYEYIRNDDIKTVRKYHPQLCEKDVAQFFCLSDFHSGVCGKVCRKSIIERNQLSFPENLSFSEDTIFFLNYIMHCHSMHVSDGTGYKYINRGGESLSSRKMDLDILLYKESCLYDLYLRIFKGHPLMTKFMREKTLYVISKYYYFEDIDDNLLQKKVFFREIIEKYLNQWDKFMLSFGLSSFSRYSRFRRRIKIYILVPLLRKHGATLLNI